MTIRKCKICPDWHDLNEAWPERCAHHWGVIIGGGSIQIIKDIEPYKAIATGVDGRRPVITCRRQHREFLKDNGYIEVGNDAPTRPKAPEYDLASGRDVKRAIEQLRNR